MKKILIFLLFALPCFARPVTSIERQAERVVFDTALTRAGETFSAADFEVIGDRPAESPGYRFRPLRAIQPLKDGDPLIYQPTGNEYWVGDAAPSVERAKAAIIAWAATPPPAPLVAVYRVLKDTIVLRIKAAGKLSQLRQVVASLNDDQKFEWDSATWFSSDNPLIISGIQAIGLDPSAILARDPLAP
jgi:hypothetical protein